MTPFDSTKKLFPIERSLRETRYRGPRVQKRDIFFDSAPAHFNQLFLLAHLLALHISRALEDKRLRPGNTKLLHSLSAFELPAGHHGFPCTFQRCRIILPYIVQGRMPAEVYFGDTWKLWCE